MILLSRLRGVVSFRKACGSLFWNVTCVNGNVFPKILFPDPYSSDAASPKCVSYVQRIRKLEHLKVNNEECRKAFSSGRYLLFRGPTVLVESALMNILTDVLNEKSKIKTDKFYENYSIVWVEYQDVLRLLESPKIDIENYLTSSSVLVGIDDDSAPLFSLEMPSSEHQLEDQILEDLKASFIRMEMAMFFAKSRKSASLTGARSLLRWHNYYKFCTKCGGHLTRNISGSQSSCSLCKKVHYPKADPATIALVVEEASKRCLLVRKSEFPPGMYTAIAGFMDIGETMEETVRREVAEEVGLEVERIEYLGSQHWPLTGSTFMLGCLVYVDPGQTVSLDTKELQDARWFTEQELHAAFNYSARQPNLRLGITSNTEGRTWVPPKPTIANALIGSWLEKLN